MHHTIIIMFSVCVCFSVSMTPNVSQFYFCDVSFSYEEKPKMCIWTWRNKVDSQIVVSAVCGGRRRPHGCVWNRANLTLITASRERLKPLKVRGIMQMKVRLKFWWLFKKANRWKKKKREKKKGKTWIKTNGFECRRWWWELDGTRWMKTWENPLNPADNPDPTSKKITS